MAPLTLTYIAQLKVNEANSTSISVLATSTPLAVTTSASSTLDPQSPSSPTASDSALVLDSGDLTRKTVLAIICGLVILSAILIGFHYVSRSDARQRNPSSPRSQTSGRQHAYPVGIAARRWRGIGSPRTSPVLSLLSRAAVPGHSRRPPTVRSGPSASPSYIRRSRSLDENSLRTLRGDDNSLGLTLSHAAYFVDDAPYTAQGRAPHMSRFDTSAVTLVELPVYPANVALPGRELAHPGQL